MSQLNYKLAGWKTNLIVGSCVSLFVWIAPANASGDHAEKGHANTQSNLKHDQKGDGQKQYTLLPDHRIITGSVESIAADQAKVDSGHIGEISPRYLSLERAKEKGFTLKQGDNVTIVVNDKNHVVDYHLSSGASQTHHQIIKGKLAQPLKVGQEHAVIKTRDGKEKSFPVRPLARSEVAAIPFDAEGLFLIDETNKVASATLTKDVKSEDDWARSSAYNVYRHIQGVVQDEPTKHSLTIQTQDKESLTLPVWDYLKGEMTEISKGTPVTVLVDSEDKIVDIAHLPQSAK